MSFDVAVWCPNCCEFHPCKKDHDHEAIYSSERCGYIVSVREARVPEK